MATKRCGVNKPCHGMKGGLLGSFFQNGNDLSGYGLGSSGTGVPFSTTFWESINTNWESINTTWN